MNVLRPGFQPDGPPPKKIRILLQCLESHDVDEQRPFIRPDLRVRRADSRHWKPHTELCSVRLTGTHRTCSTLEGSSVTASET